MKGQLLVPGALLQKMLRRGTLLREILQRVLKSRASTPPKQLRAISADNVLNTLEMEWWDRNALLVAQTWEFDDQLTEAVRGGYLSESTAFFKENCSENGAILELGCGSGWVGRHLARNGLRIFGTDFSQSQISLATQRANNEGLDNCTYRLCDGSGWPSDAPRIDGVLIHAFLHHLDETEILSLIKSIKEKVTQGTRIWIYEPACYANSDFSSAQLPGNVQFLIDVAQKVADTVASKAAEMDMLDEEVHAAFKSLQQNALENGYYLSPKEVPLDIEWFTSMLEDNFSSVSGGWKTINLIGWTYHVNLMKNSVVYEDVCKTVVPAFIEADKKLASCTEYLRKTMVAPAHAFYAWEVIA